MKASGTSLLLGLEELISRGDFVVPPYPAAALRLRRLVNSQKFGLADVADAAASDPALAATLLRIANSAAYRGNGPAITTLGRAVHRLGAKAIASLALTAGIAGAALEHGPLVDVKYRVWRRSITCALCCQKLAAARGVDADEAFLAGLLYGFGRSVAVACLERVTPTGSAQARPLLDWLAAVEPYRHTLAKRVAQSWELPAELAEALSGSTTKPEQKTLVALLELADRIAGALDGGASAELAAALVGASEKETRTVAHFIADLPQTLDTLLEAPEARKVEGPNAVSKPDTALAGEARPVNVELTDLKSRKERRPLKLMSVTPDGLVFLSDRPMQESCVARLGIGVGPNALEGWFSVSLCVRERDHFRVEAQAFAPSRQIKEQLAELWNSAARG
ncbi:MAG: HDOD domain-containing protein [Myxococcota bacterium]